MAASDTDPAQAGLADRIGRAIAHAEGATRCWLALLAAEGERRGRGLLGEAVWLGALVGVGVIGLGLLAWGLSAYLTSRMAVPGAGPMVVGGFLAAAFLAVMGVRWARQKR